MESTAPNADAPPLRLLFVHSSDDLYGADRILLELTRRLDRRRFTPLVVLPTDIVTHGALSKALDEAGVRTINLDLAVLRRQYLTPWGALDFARRLLVSSWLLARLIRRESVDVVHSHTSAVLSGAVAARLTGRPHVWQTLEIIVRPHFLARTIAWLMPRLAARVVAASGPTYEHLCRGDRRNLEKATVIRYGLDPAWVSSGRGAALRSAWGLTPEHALVAVVGRVSEWKGQDYFLRMAARVVPQHPNARFLVVGGTFLERPQLTEELKRFAQEAGIAEVVIFEGFRGDVPAVLDAIDVFVLPSTLPDPFPTAILEAMAAGKPVVANAHGGSVEMVEHGETGFLVPPGDLDAMAASVARLLERPDERKRMGEAGRARLLAQFTIDRYVGSWSRLYVDVAGDRRAVHKSCPAQSSDAGT